MPTATERLTIRALTPDDHADWHRLWTDYLAFYETKVTPEVYETTFTRLTGGGTNEFRGLIARLEGAAVGLTHFLGHRHCWRIDNVMYLQDLFVDPAFRGQGVGRALIEAVYAEADRDGTPSVYWLTHESNHTARRLYDRVASNSGFIRYGRVVR